MRKLLPILVVPILALTSCDRGEKESTTSRYSTQTFAVAGGTTAVTQITDHELNKIYYYKISEEGLALQDTIDLTKSGDQKIPYERDNRDEVDTAE